MAKKKPTGSDFASALLDDFDRFEHFAMTYWRQIIIACVAIVVIVAAGTTIYVVMTAKERDANNRIANAVMEAELLKVISEYPENPALCSVRTRLAVIYRNEKKYEQAVNQYRSIAMGNYPDEIRWQSQLAMNAVLELDGKKEQAARGYKAIGANSMISPAIRSEANYSAGRIYSELGDDASAKLALTAAVKAENRTQPATYLWGELARPMLERIQGEAPVNPKASSTADIEALLKKSEAKPKTTKP